ncbi:dihydrofolate reductase family protein [Sphingobacterium sp. HJSM2_6]|uniref:dihydrofolate reductase family protein n=1 Tax=Sphingobacterium sp. HJSM2_6 TaxID=3366264 RepID=UPI003BE49F3C
MRKIIAAINTTLDGICDHTVGIPDGELHHYYAELLSNSDAILFGRVTYQLMEFWKTLVENPSGEKSMDHFAHVIDHIPKLVFSRTLDHVNWESAKLAEHNLDEEILILKQQPGKDILVGSRSLIIQLLELNLIDEFQLSIHPVVAGGGLSLFEGYKNSTEFKLINSKIFLSGVVTLYYACSTHTRKHT